MTGTVGNLPAERLIRPSQRGADDCERNGAGSEVAAGAVCVSALYPSFGCSRCQVVFT
jgi:hypothetical protein